VSGKGFFSHVTVGLTGWSGEEMTVEAVAFTPNVRVQVFSSPYYTVSEGESFFLCCRGDGADERNTQHYTTVALVPFIRREIKI